MIILSIKMSKQSEKREFVIHLFLQNPKWKRTQIAREANVCVKTVHNAIKKYRMDIKVTRKKGSDKPQVAKKVAALLEKNPRLSTRKLAKKLDVSQSTIVE